MKRLKFLLVCVFVTGMVTFPQKAEVASPDISILINGEQITFPQKPFIESGTTLVPMRAVFEALGTTVTWDGTTRTVTAKDAATTVKLTINKPTAIVNDEIVPITIPAKIVNGSTFVPLRFVSESLGAKVGWDGQTRTVSINKQENLEMNEILSDLENMLGTKFFEDIILEVPVGTVVVDELTSLTVYEIANESITKVFEEDVNTELIALRDDAEVQEALWELVKTMIPANYRSNITEIGFFTDGFEDTLAYVQQLENDPTKWAVFIDLQDIDHASTLFATLVHEYAHVLSLNVEQLELDEEVYFTGDEALIEEVKAQCSNLFLQEGCANDDSYINLFHDAFWMDIKEEWEKMVDPEDEDSALAFYEQHQDKFVNDYAATNVAEDFAESFTYFVLQPKPEGNTEIEEKMLFFYQFPELVQLRADILTNLKSYVESSLIQ